MQATVVMIEEAIATVSKAKAEGFIGDSQEIVLEQIVLTRTICN